MKYSLLAISIASTFLFGCGGSDNTSKNLPEGKALPLTRMTSVQAGFQTFKERNLHPQSSFSVSKAADFTNNEQYDDGKSAYVYENAQTGEVVSVTFEGKDPATDEASPLPEPKIFSIVDLNSNYSAINFDNVSVEVNGNNYFGRYTLIQDKTTGDLYPLVENEQPIYKAVVAEHEAWITSARFSHTADESRIYFRHGEPSPDGNQGLSLHVGELVNGTFVISKIFDDYHRNNWVLPNGDVISRPWSANSLTWIEKENGKEHTFSFDFSEYTNPFVFEGKLYIVNSSSEQMLELKLNDNVLEPTLTTWVTNGYNTDANNNTVRRGNYEMQANCAVYLFDTESKTITQHLMPKANNGFAPAAGQYSLFCLHSENDNSNDLPSFTRFDIQDENITVVQASSGTKLNANERMSVVSD